MCATRRQKISRKGEQKEEGKEGGKEEEEKEGMGVRTSHSESGELGFICQECTFHTSRYREVCLAVLPSSNVFSCAVQ